MSLALGNEEPCANDLFVAGGVMAPASASAAVADTRAGGATVGAVLGATYPAAALTDVRSKTFTSFLDFSRWTAAAIVFVGHLRDPLFLGYGNVAAADRSALVKLWYFVTGWHAEAVVVFFVLSGFLVGGLAAAKLKVGRFSLSAYAIDRSTRIYLAFLPALLLTVVLDQTGVRWLDGAGLYDGTQAMIHQKLVGVDFSQRMSPQTFGYNLVLLQTFFAPAYGSNGPLWTISIEFWFYVVFGFAALAVLRRGSALGWLAVAATLGTMTILGRDFVGMLGLWLVGTSLAFLPRGRLEKPALAAFVLVVALVLARINDDLFRESENWRVLKNYGIALAFGWLVVSMRRISWPPLIRLSSLNKHMADFSYSLYLIHFPLLIFFLSALHATGLFPEISTGYAPTSVVGLTLYVALIVAIYGLAWGFSHLTERRTGDVRRWLQATLIGR